MKWPMLNLLGVPRELKMQLFPIYLMARISASDDSLTSKEPETENILSITSLEGKLL